MIGRDHMLQGRKPKRRLAAKVLRLVDGLDMILGRRVVVCICYDSKLGQPRVLGLLVLGFLDFCLFSQ
jgi:hypothetical protein